MLLARTFALSLLLPPLLAQQQPLASIEALAGNAQRAAVWTRVAEPLRVRIRLANGQPLADKLVTFAITRGDGLLAAIDSTIARPVLRVRTDADGIAAAHWQLGTAAGDQTQRVEVSSAGCGASATFSAVADPGPARHLELLATPPVELPPGSELTLRVRATDGHNPVAAAVTFTVRRGEGRFGGAASVTVTANGDGIAAATFAAGNPVGPQELALALPGGRPLTLRLNVHADAAAPTLPTLLPIVDPRNQASYRRDLDTVLTIAGIDGLRLRIAAGSMRLADGSPAPTGTAIALAQVPLEQLDLGPGTATPWLAWLLEPADATFDPPIAITLPNADGLPAGMHTTLCAPFPELTRLCDVTVARDGRTLTSDVDHGLRRGGLCCLLGRRTTMAETADFDWNTDDPAAATPERLQNARATLNSLIASWTALGWTTSATHMNHFLHGERDEVVYPAGSEVSELAAGTLEFFVYVYRPVAGALHERVTSAPADATTIEDFTVPARGFRFVRADLATAIGEIHPWQSKIRVHGVRIDRAAGTYDAVVDVELGDRYEFNGIGMEDPYYAARARFLQRWGSVRQFDVRLQHRIVVSKRSLAMALPWLGGLQAVRGAPAVVAGEGQTAAPLLPLPSEPLRYLLGDRDPARASAPGLVPGIVGLVATVNPESLTRPDQTAKLTVTATTTDGAARDVGSAAAGTVFSVSDPGVVEIDGSGVVRPRGPGGAFLGAHWRGVLAVTRLRVELPDPLTTVEGLLLDAQLRPVVNARVEVAGRGGFTDLGGRFSIGGVPSREAIQVVAGSVQFPVAVPEPGGITDCGIAR